MGEKEKALENLTVESVKSVQRAFEACATPKEVIDLYGELVKEMNQLAKSAMAMIKA